MSDTPIHDQLQTMQQAARQLGYIEGRTSMREQVLTILREATKHPQPALVAAIQKIEQLAVTK